MNGRTVVSHTLEPYFNSDSKVLILGTMPSPKSIEIGFYYGHPQNRFWKVLAEIFNCEVPPVTIDDRKAFLKRHKIALWDVLKECSIQGASDASIKDCVPNNLNEVFQVAQIKCIFTTGKKAHDLYQRYWKNTLETDVIALPSTSPANCAVKMNELIDAYHCIREYIEE